MEFNFKIKEDRLFASEALTANSGNVNVYVCSFEIADNAELTWLCVFTRDNKAYQQVIENGKCIIPKEVLESAGTLRIGCYGTGDNRRISTNWLEFSISDGAYCEATMPEEPSPDVWETLVMNNLPYIGENGNWYVYDKAKKIYTDSRNPSRGEKGDTGDKGDAGLDGYTPQRGIDYWTEEDIASIIDDIYDIKQDIVQEAGADKYKAMSQNAASRLFSNSLKSVKIGEAILISDISPIEHEMNVSVRSKNLAYPADGYVYPNVTKGTVISHKCDKLCAGKTYTMSFDTADTTDEAGRMVRLKTVAAVIDNHTMEKSQSVYADGTRKSITFTMTADFERSHPVSFIEVANNPNNIEVSCSNFQIEEGTTATAYAPYADLASATVTRYGANLFDHTLVVEREHSSSGTTTTLTEDGGVRLTGTVVGAAGATLDRMAHATGFLNPIYLPAGTYSNPYGRVLGETDGFFGFVFDYNDGSNKVYRWEKTFTLTKPAYLVNAVFRLAVGKTYDFTIYPSLILGSVPEKAEYIEPATYMPNADGMVEGVTSLYPTTTLLADTQGVIIDCEYNRDINKAFEELTQAIISLGGNV